MFYDTEHDTYITLADLEQEYKTLAAVGETDCKTFKEYINETTGKNGTLERVNDWNRI